LRGSDAPTTPMTVRSRFAAVTRRRFVPQALGVLAVAAVLLAASGCRTLGYYGHVATGHTVLMAKRQPIDRLLADPSTPLALRRQLDTVQRARAFASDRLGLPRNRSYTRYVELDRPYVTWNVFAAPELSLQPLLHCFPIAGCVAYRGYFERARADREAARLRAAGYETWVGGVSAYSTLGWYADPVLSTMLRGEEDAVVGTIFHELSHQQIYLRDDTAFNESLAMFVQQQGLREWRAQQGRAAVEDDGALRQRRFVERVLVLRAALEALYAQPIDDTAKRAGKAAAIAAFRADYWRWRDGAGRAHAEHDAWVREPIDNARLVPIGLYDQWVPAFEALFSEVGGDWPTFHARAAEIGRLDAAERQARLRALQGAG
jgi:predicted aminopeptidase